jgi:UDP-N-acetyl-D-glucosamine dehydrogenase
MQTEFIELAGEVNQRMPYFCVEKIARALNEQSKAVKGSRVAIVGVSYKPGVGDVRESPALKIIELLREQGADVTYHDDYVPELGVFGLRSEPVEGADCAAIVTAHPELDVEKLLREVPAVVDFRGVTRRVPAA